MKDKIWLIYYTKEGWQINHNQYDSVYYARQAAEELINEGEASKVLVCKVDSLCERKPEWDEPRVG